MPNRRPDHVPQRSCAVCRRVQPKRVMTRLVRGSDGLVRADPSGRAHGRGTYLCDDPACREPRRLADGVQRALGVAVEPTPARSCRGEGPTYIAIPRAWKMPCARVRSLEHFERAWMSDEPLPLGPTSRGIGFVEGS